MVAPEWQNDDWDERKHDEGRRAYARTFDLSRAAEVMSMSLRELRSDPIAQKWIEEVDEEITVQLEAAALRRAIRGQQKTTVKNGTVVAIETSYSDTLTGQMLRSRMERYNPKIKVSMTPADYVAALQEDMALMFDSVPYVEED